MDIYSRHFWTNLTRIMSLLSNMPSRFAKWRFFRLLVTLNNVNLQPRLPINYSERSCQSEMTASFSNKHCNFRHWKFGLSQWRQIYILCSTLQIWKMMALSKNVFERPFMYKEQAVLTFVCSWFINLEIKNCFSCQTFYGGGNTTCRNGHCSKFCFLGRNHAFFDWIA